MADLLAIYLNDHLAGATVGRELAKRAARENKGTELGEFLDRLHGEIVEDRQSLIEVMRAVDAREDPLKRAGALAGERLGRFKLNGSLFGYSPLSRVVELEGLCLGVEGKKGLWRALKNAADPRLRAFDFTALEQRAQRQRDQLEEHRLAATREAFGAS